MASTGSEEEDFTICSTIFCDGAGGKPSIVSAATASSTTSRATIPETSFSVEWLVSIPVSRGILSFRSTMMRCAALGPMPFYFWQAIWQAM